MANNIKRKLAELRSDVHNSRFYPDIETQDHEQKPLVLLARLIALLEHERAD